MNRKHSPGFTVIELIVVLEQLGLKRCPPSRSAEALAAERFGRKHWLPPGSSTRNVVRRKKTGKILCFGEW